MTHYHVTALSSNKKTGPIPVTTTSDNTCPDACPLKKSKVCYAKSGPLAIHWRKVSSGERGTDASGLNQTVRKFKNNQVWRYGQAGDLPGEGNQIDAEQLAKLVKANRHRPNLAYTHKPVLKNEHNRLAIKNANDNGFTINLSANNAKQADDLLALNIAPVVAIIPLNAPNVTRTPNGAKIVACPAETKKRVNCASCALCHKRNRDYVIGFRAHGSKKKQANAIAEIE